MFLKKWRERLDGIFQAIGYDHKSPEITCGLKLGAYFISLSVIMLDYLLFLLTYLCPDLSVDGRAVSGF
jgi:hypothetical protein